MPPFNHNHHLPLQSSGSAISIDTNITPSSSSSSSRPSLTASSSSISASLPSESELSISSPLQRLHTYDDTDDPTKPFHFQSEEYNCTFEEEMKQKMEYRNENQGIMPQHGLRPPHIRAKTFAKVPERPALPQRQSSFQKRHASFDTPREIALPVSHMSSQLHRAQASQSSTSSASSPVPSRFGTANVSERAIFSKNDAPCVTVTGRSAIDASNSILKQKSPPIYGSRPHLQRDDFLGFDGAVLADGSSSDTSTPSTSSLRSVDSPPTLQPRLLRPLATDKSNIDEMMDGQRSSQGLGKGKEREQQGYFSQSPPPEQQPQQPFKSTSANSSTPVTPFSRPYSTPDASEPFIPGQVYSPTPLKPWDRNSTASLPLPSQTPYFALPSVTQMGAVSEEGKDRESTVAATSRHVSPPLFDPSVPSSPDLSPSTARPPTPPALARASTSGSVQSTVSVPTQPVIRTVTSFIDTRSPASVGSFPPPQPPTILTPPPPPASPHEESATRRPAPYEPFLSHAPPPEDSWIAVETTHREYKLMVRLPGFRRDGITLATRRRRILHVFADSWEPGGGHFERRISFGYDADLAHVRAEFDGEMLKISVPRRSPATSWNAPNL